MSQLTNFNNWLYNNIQHLVSSRIVASFFSHSLSFNGAIESVTLSGSWLSNGRLDDKFGGRCCCFGVRSDSEVFGDFSSVMSFWKAGGGF